MSSNKPPGSFFWIFWKYEGGLIERGILWGGLINFLVFGDIPFESHIPLNYTCFFIRKKFIRK